MQRGKFFAPLFILAIFAMAAGCAKPAVRGGYPPSPVYERPMPEIGARPEAEKEKKETSDSDDRLLAAVAPLEKQANVYLASRELDKAEATTERAMRLSPNDARLWSLMAEIQLAKENWNQAEQFAAKSNLLAGSDSGLKAKNWRTISESLRRRNMTQKAEQALEKARALESP